VKRRQRGYSRPGGVVCPCERPDGSDHSGRLRRRTRGQLRDARWRQRSCSQAGGDGCAHGWVSGSDLLRTRWQYLLDGRWRRWQRSSSARHQRTRRCGSLWGLRWRRRIFRGAQAADSAESSVLGANSGRRRGGSRWRGRLIAQGWERSIARVGQWSAVVDAACLPTQRHETDSGGGGRLPREGWRSTAEDV
jgi:hypothetical protein